MNKNSVTGQRKTPPERYQYMRVNRFQRNRQLRARYNKLRQENRKLKEIIAQQDAQMEARVAEALSAQAAVSPLLCAFNRDTPQRGKRTKKLILFCLAAVLLIGAISAVFVYAFDTGLIIPAGGVRDVVILEGHTVMPDAFIVPFDEMAGVTAEFHNPKQICFSSPGRQEVALSLKDGRRSATVQAALYVLSPTPYVEIEAGTTDTLSLTSNLISNWYIARPKHHLYLQIYTNPADICTKQVGRHPIEFSVNGAAFTTIFYVVDTTPPAATPVNLVVPMGYEVRPEYFVANIFDISPVVLIAFVYVPYMFIPGDQTVEIILEDYFGNSAIYASTLTILPNLVRPRIYGTQDIFVQQGSPIMFRRGISAYDAFDRPIQFTVDSSGVDVDTLGVYTVVYHTVDAWGLTAEATARVYVIAVDPDRVRTMADTVLEGILQDDMTQVEQARAIFDWIGRNVAYSAHVRRPTLYENAYQGLRNRQGNCFVFYSLSEVMLTQAGIPNMQISRYGGTSNHTWNLINPDNLGWHHFDTTPLVATVGHRVDRFMFTSSQAQAFTEIIAREVFTPNYFTYNPALYPEIVQ